MLLLVCMYIGFFIQNIYKKNHLFYCALYVIIFIYVIKNVIKNVISLGKICDYIQKNLMWWIFSYFKAIK